MKKDLNKMSIDEWIKKSKELGFKNTTLKKQEDTEFILKYFILSIIVSILLYIFGII